MHLYYAIHGSRSRRRRGWGNLGTCTIIKEGRCPTKSRREFIEIWKSPSETEAKKLNTIRNSIIRTKAYIICIFDSSIPLSSGVLYGWPLSALNTDGFRNRPAFGQGRKRDFTRTRTLVRSKSPCSAFKPA